MLVLFLLSILKATEPNREFRLIKIVPPQQLSVPVSATSTTSSTQVEGYGVRGQEYGVGRFFHDSHAETEDAAMWNEKMKKDQSTIKSIFQDQLKFCYTQRGSSSNPLMVQFKFKDNDDNYSPFVIYCGVFISGSDIQRETMDLPFDVDASANTKMTQLKLSGAESQAWDTVKRCLTDRREQGQKGKICCKYPHATIDAQHFCSGSLRDIYELEKEGGELTPKEHQSFVKGNLLGLPAEGDSRPRLGEIYNNPDCFADDFTGNFYDSEQVWLKFISSPTPPLKYVRFAGMHNEKTIKELEISLISYLDICRYCRGTLSVLLSRETEKLFFHHFLYRNLPAALLTRMKHKECLEQEFQILCSNFQSLGKVCGFSQKIPRYIGELQKIRDTIQLLNKFKIDSLLPEIQQIGTILKSLKNMYDVEVEGLVRSGFYDKSNGLLLISIYAYSFQQIPSRRA